MITSSSHLQTPVKNVDKNKTRNGFLYLDIPQYTNVLRMWTILASRT